MKTMKTMKTMNYFKTMLDGTRRIFGFEDKVKDVEVPPVGMVVSEEVVRKPLTLQNIREEMVATFEFELQENSFDNCVLFPMVATVVLNSKDFAKRREYFYELGANAVDQFYKVIRQAAVEGKQYKHMATYWTIEFVECISGDSVDFGGSSINAEEGKCVIFFSVFDKLGDIKEDAEMQIAYSVKFSGHDDFREININREMLRSINIISDTRFQYPWDESKVRTGRCIQLDAPVSKPQRGPVASLEYMEDFEKRTFLIRESQCRISGLSETSRDNNVCRLASQAVKAGHVTIQFFEDENRFKVSTTGDTMLNNHPMEISTGTDCVWMDLPDKSELVLARNIIIRFNKLIG
jgi:hypothetical protein